MPFIHHRFGKTFYVIKGHGSQIPFVYLHGGPGGRHEWNAPILKLSKNRKVFLYDQIGGGKSSPTPKKLWSIQTFVDELDMLVKKWGLKEFHLGGHSWGTTLALEYYLRNGAATVRSLIFASPFFSAKAWKTDAVKLIRKLSAKDRAIINACHKIGATDSKVYERAMMAYYSRHVLRDKNKLAEVMKSFAAGHGNGLNIYSYMWGPSEFEPTGTLKLYERVKDLRKIEVPTLFLCGEYDEATPATVRTFHKRVKNSELVVLKGCSHASISEKPALVLKIIDTFLR